MTLIGREINTEVDKPKMNYAIDLNKQAKIRKTADVHINIHAG